MFVLPVDDEIELVLAEERHAEEVSALIRRNQARLARWEPWAQYPATTETVRRFIRACLDGFAAGSQAQTYVRYDGRLVGACGLRIHGAPEVGEVGYWLDGEHEGRGIASRAVAALVRASFGERRLARIELRTAVDNRRSQALAERLGFHREGVLRNAQAFADRRVDMALYAVLAREWRG